MQAMSHPTGENGRKTIKKLSERSLLHFALTFKFFARSIARRSAAPHRAPLGTKIECPESRAAISSKRRSEESARAVGEPI